MRLEVDEVRVHEIHVEDRPADRPLLSEAERERADRFYFERDRVLFTAAHAGLRRVLAEHLDGDPAGLGFEEDDLGRPGLVGVEGLHFSLSHSGDRALVAVACMPRVGVDVEVHRDRIELERLAERNFSLAERAELLECRGEDLVRGFFRIWTRKEAYVKALGKGLRHPLEDFDVNMGDQARFGSFRDGSDPARWSRVDLSLGANRAGALAVELPAVRVRLTR